MIQFVVSDIAMYVNDSTSRSIHYYIIMHQWCVQEFIRGGGRKSERLFFLLSNISRGGPAQKIADKIIFPTKKVAKYR